MANSALSLHGPIGVQDNRNELINGDFNIWQRGTTASVGVTGRASTTCLQNSFVADRWRVYSQAVSGVTAPPLVISRRLMPLGYPSGADRASKWYLNIFVGNSADKMGGAGAAALGNYGGFTGAGATTNGTFLALVQDIDDVSTLEGKTCILSFWAKSNITNQRVAPIVKQCYAGRTAGDSPSLIKGSTGNLGFTLDSTWRQYKTSFNIPGIEGQPAVGTSGDDALQVQLVLHSNGVHGASMELGGPSEAARTGDISFSQIQLEQGSKSTEFDKTNPAQEIFECGRFYQKTYNLDSTPGTNTNFAGMHALNYPTTGRDAVTHHEFVPPMKSTPTVTVYDNVGNINKTSHGNGTNNVNVSKHHISERGFNWGVDPPVGVGIYYVHVVVDSELTVDTN